MRILSKIINTAENVVDNRNRIIVIDLQTRLYVQYQYNGKTTVHSNENVLQQFYGVKHGKQWVSFSHANFNSKFLFLFKRRYNSTKEIDTVSAIRLAHDYNKRILCEYAKKVHPRVSEDDVKISFEDVHLVKSGGLEYAIPTAITITIADPTGRRSAITNCLREF